MPSLVNTRLYAICFPTNGLGLKRLIVFPFLLFAYHTPAEVNSGYLSRSYDGDTISIQTNDMVRKIRLYGIDAPEIGQEFGTEARDFVRELTAGRTMNFEHLGSDRYGRDVAIVRFPDGRSLNAELVRQGYAWWSRRHAPDNLELADAEREARSQKRGLWRQAEPVPPWVWRAEINQSEERNHRRFRHSLEHIR
jgi:endonuclease YncB( thermonuclease family)